MAIIDHEYPYSFYHELNLDWILSKLKEWEEDWQGKEVLIQNIEQLARDAMASATEAHALASSVSGVAQSAYNTANNASDTAQEAYTLAAGVRSVADNALATAQSAEAKASTATATAGDAYSLAFGVRSVADNAFTVAEGAMDLAESASEAAGIAEQAAQTAGTAAANANNRLDAINDYVVESGYKGNWFYKIWNSGRQEAWYRCTAALAQARDYTTAYGAVYFSNGSVDILCDELKWQYAPQTMVSIRSDSGIWGASVRQTQLSNDVATVSMYIYAFRSFSNFTVYPDIYLVGQKKVGT